jgi:Domain of unknown function (DUF4386)
MKSEKTIGILMILGAIGVFIPYTILTIIFNYPEVLRQDPASVLHQFHNGGPALIFTWLAFALMGLLRWVFVVPVLANDFVNTNDPVLQKSIITSFKVIHQFGGVLLGEHLGQLFTIIWTVGISFALSKSAMISRWLGWLGLIASAIYLLAQGELFATVIPGFPVWDLAGFIGSTLWLLWLIAIGISMTISKN